MSTGIKLSSESSHREGEREGEILEKKKEEGKKRIVFHHHEEGGVSNFG